MNRVKKCMHNKCMGLYGNLTSSFVKRKQAFSNPMWSVNVLSRILPGEKIEDFHFKAVFIGILNTTYGCSIIVFTLPVWFMCCHSKMLRSDSHGMKERGHNALCLSHRAGEGFAGLSKVASCLRKSSPTWLVSAGYSTWNFFTDGVCWIKYPWTGHLLWQLSRLPQNFLTILGLDPFLRILGLQPCDKAAMLVLCRWSIK